MARYRLRLLLQEFDLPPGETLLGRSPECHVTIDDPLVSREHARVEVRGDQVFFHDLGSRNGSKINGNQVSGSLELHDGDRLRIGNQELVFSRVVGTKSRGRPTGSLRHCRRCATPYPGESPTCPTCGFSPSHDDTLSGTMAARAAVASLDRDSWSLAMHLELIDRALSIHRLDEAERATKRMSEAIDERIASGGRVDLTAIAPAYERAVRLAVAKGASEWIAWVMRIAVQLDAPPTATAMALLEQAPPSAVDGAAPEIEAAIAKWTQSSPGAPRDVILAIRRVHLLGEAIRARAAQRAGRGS